MKRPSLIADAIVELAQRLSVSVDQLSFGPPVAMAYNPLSYAWAAHEAYLRKFACTRKRVVFLGMNPGPFGMVQTGVPFGEISAVRDWMKIDAAIGQPRQVHPKRPVEGFACVRSEVSGRRLWGLFSQRWNRAEDFFQEHFVANYCPLAFLDAAGRNLTPDKLPAPQSAALTACCDLHLRSMIEVLRPEWLIGIGDYAERRAGLVLKNAPVKLGKVLHPSPASPAANQDWAGQAVAQLESLGIWTPTEPGPGGA